LEQLVNVIATKNELDQTSVTNLLRNLYPAERVSSIILLKAVNSLGQSQNKPSAATQAGLVKWISAVHEFLVEPELLLRLYSVFFNLLDITSLR
jgi:centromere protein I